MCARTEQRLIYVVFAPTLVLPSERQAGCWHCDMPVESGRERTATMSGIDRRRLRRPSHAGHRGAGCGRSNMATFRLHLIL